MNNALLVHVTQSPQDLLDNPGGVWVQKFALLNDVVEKFSTWDDFWHDVIVDIVLKQLIDPHDVRVVHIRKHLKFLNH